MPRKPRGPCRYQGCNRLAEEGEQFCKEHKKLTDSQYNRYTRSPDIHRKYGSAWKRIRERYAAEHPLCEKCLKEGRLTPVEEVHHIVPVSQGGTHEWSNLESLCQSCHTKVHRNELHDR